MTVKFCVIDDQPKDPKRDNSFKVAMETYISSPVVKSFLAGSLSGTCSTILFQPLDLVKTRIQAPVAIGNGQVGMLAVVTNVVRNEKLLGLWKGMAPSLTRTVPGIGMYFSSLHTLRSNFGSADPSPLESIAMGMTARCIAGASMLPFTVVKTRFESGQYKYRSIHQALVTIYKVEGVKGLFSGLMATLMRDAPFSGLYLMFYTQTKKLVHKNADLLAVLIPCSLCPGGDGVNPTQSPLVHFSCGILAGCFASVVTQPADVVKTHMQLYPDRFSTVRFAILHIHRESGLQGFMKGIVPRTIRRTLMAALAWTVYEQAMLYFGLK